MPIQSFKVANKLGVNYEAAADTDTGKTTIETVCPECNGTTELNVMYSQIVAWKNGTLIQHAFPTLDIDEREMLMTGTCVKCWDKMFGEEDEAEGDPEPMDPREPYPPGHDGGDDEPETPQF